MDYNPFSSDDSVGNGFTSLEERVFNQEIDNDECEYKAIRLRSWQQQALRQVKNDTGSNETDVSHALYTEGSIILRDHVGYERVKEHISLADTMRRFYGISNNFGKDVNKYRNEMVGLEANDPLRGMGRCVHKTTAKLPDSVFSEVKDTYEVEAAFGPWIHRAVLAMGFKKSTVLDGADTERAADTADVVLTEFKDSRDTLESLVVDTIVENMGFWTSEGIYEEQLEVMRELPDLMNTQRSGMVEGMLSQIEHDAEVLTNEFGDGSDTTQGTL